MVHDVNKQTPLRPRVYKQHHVCQRGYKKHVIATVTKTNINKQHFLFIFCTTTHTPDTCKKKHSTTTTRFHTSTSQTLLILLLPSALPFFIFSPSRMPHTSPSHTQKYWTPDSTHLWPCRSNRHGDEKTLNEDYGRERTRVEERKGRDARQEEGKEM